MCQCESKIPSPSRFLPEGKVKTRVRTYQRESNSRTKYGEEDVRNQYNVTSKRNFSEFQTALSDMTMQNHFNKMSVFECQIISESIHKLKQEKFKYFQVLLYKFKDIQGLDFLFSNSRTFKDFQVLYEPCKTPTGLKLQPIYTIRLNQT